MGEDVGVGVDGLVEVGLPETEPDFMDVIVDEEAFSDIEGGNDGRLDYEPFFLSDACGFAGSGVQTEDFT